MKKVLVSRESAFVKAADSRDAVVQRLQCVEVSDFAAMRQVVLARAAKCNALTTSMMREITQAIGTAGGDTRLVVIRAQGNRVFCAGADLDENRAGEASLAGWEQAFQDLAVALDSSAVPVLCCVHGRVLGGGAVLAGLSDVVIARADTVFAFPEMQLGIYPALVHAALVPRIAASTMFQIFASARHFGAGEAQQLGLVTEILPLDGFDEASSVRAAYFAQRTEALLLGRELRAGQPALSVRERMAAVAVRASQHFRSEQVRSLRRPVT